MREKASCDQCSQFLFIKEGILFQKIQRHSERYPEAAAALSLTLLPFCGLIVHDGVRFVRNNFDSAIALDAQSVNRLRNATKSLSLESVKVEDYLAEIEEVTDHLKGLFKKHTGFFGGLANVLQPDVGISYCGELAVYTTYNVTRYLVRCNNGVDGALDRNSAFEIGEEIGKAASASYYLVEMLGIDACALEFQEFSLDSRDFHYHNLKKPLMEHGLSNPACFFMLCEMLTQLNSITALRQKSFLSDIVEMKLTLAALIVLSKSISKLSGYIAVTPSFESDSKKALRALGGVIPRKHRKILGRLQGLRNALVHYDFPGLLGSEFCDKATAEEILEAATKKTVGMEAAELLEWLRLRRNDISQNLSELLELPPMVNR